MKYLRSLALIAVIAGAALVATPASASVTAEWFSGDLNQTSDNSAEWLWNNPLYAQGPTVGTLNVGDVIFAVSEFTTNENLSAAAPTNFYATGADTMAFTAVAALQVKSITPAGTTPGGVALADITFGPVGALSLAAIGGVPTLAPVFATLGTWVPGTVLASYENTLGTAFARTGPDDPLAPIPPPAHPDVGIGPFAAESAQWAIAADGSFIWEMGFTGALTPITGGPAGDVAPAPIAGEGLTTFAVPTDITALASVPAGTAVGTFQAGFNETFAHLPSVSYGPVGTFFGMADFAASGSTIGIAGIDTAHDNFDNVDVTFRPGIIPEPTMLLVFGGLFAFAIIARHRLRFGLGE